MPQYRPLVRAIKAVVFVAFIGGGVASALIDNHSWWLAGFCVACGLAAGLLTIRRWRRERHRVVKARGPT
jgi:hypothetical protein